LANGRGHAPPAAADSSGHFWTAVTIRQQQDAGDRPGGQPRNADPHLALAMPFAHHDPPLATPLAHASPEALRPAVTDSLPFSAWRQAAGAPVAICRRLRFAPAEGGTKFHFDTRQFDI